MAVKKTHLKNTSPFAYTDGTLFNGYLLLVLSFPSANNGAPYTYAVLNDSAQRLRLPSVYKFPIRNGYLVEDAYVWANFGADISIYPPEVFYSPLYYDNTDRLVKIENDNYGLPSGEQTIATATPFTLPSNAGTGHGETVPGNVPIVETPTGVVNGVNTAFTLSRVPNSLILFRDGNGPLSSPTDYTLSGATLTMAVAPVVASQFKAYIF